MCCRFCAQSVFSKILVWSNYWCLHVAELKQGASIIYSIRQVLPTRFTNPAQIPLNLSIIKLFTFIFQLLWFSLGTKCCKTNPSQNKQKILQKRVFVHNDFVLKPWVLQLKTADISLCPFVLSYCTQGSWPSLGAQFGECSQQWGLLFLRCAGQALGPTARSPPRKRVFPMRRHSNRRMEPPQDPLSHYPG